VSEKSAAGRPIRQIAVRVHVGEHLLAASDDPLFLGLRGPAGREFRLSLAHGKSLRRGATDRFVLGSPDDPETNVAHAEINDPTNPPIDTGGVTSVYLRKGFDPIPNVRAVAEMDDRLELVEAEIEIRVEGSEKPLRYFRRGPIWMGLVAGLRFELPLVDATS